MSAASAMPLRRRSARRSTRPSARFLVTAAVLLDILFLAGALAVWPVYRSSAYVIMVAAALVLAHLIAWFGMRLRWSGWWVALVAFGAYLVFGLPVAAPAMLGGVDQMLTGFVGIVTAPVTGWKDLLTLDLPLGSYRTTLAPAFLLFIGIPVAALSLAWRAQRLWILAPVLGLLLPAFGVLFGADELSDPVHWAGLTLPGPVETVVGAAAVLAALAFVVWRTLDERRRALRAAEAATGVRTTGRSGSAVAGRVAISAGMIIASLAVGAAVTPLALADQDREVLRDRIDPRLEIQQQLSPLSQYRAFFGDDQFDEVLFTVDAGAVADRVRLATLSFYDGQATRVADPAAPTGDDAATFTRVPSSLPAPDGTRSVSAGVSIGGYRGVWTPTVGSLTSISFTGATGAAIGDGFFYNASTRMGVSLGDPGLSTGVTYRQGGAVEVALPAVGDLVPARTSPQLDESIVPQSLVDWIREQQAPADGQGLSVLIERLRARGYLSHALTEADGALWRAALGDYAFESSRAGHSTDRIDTLFAALLQRQNEVGGEDDDQLVAAVGDDEQFAVAALMIADQLGFPARVVLGARLIDDGDENAMPACADGVCRGANMTAWIEVQDASGVWVPIDVTPQHTVGMTPEDLQHRDPEVPTEVRDDHAEAVQPGEANPADSGERDEDAATDAADLTALWATLRIAGIGLLGALVLAGPFLLIVLVKGLRRRGRRDAPEAVDRVTGGWDEYVDTAVDLGLEPPSTRTRQELAVLYGGEAPEGSVALATLADRAVFDAAPTSNGDSERFWQIVDEERARLASGRSRWGRLRARLSLRSLLRRAATQARAPRGTEKEVSRR